jgi:hypothetical protein
MVRQAAEGRHRSCNSKSIIAPRQGPTTAEERVLVTVDIRRPVVLSQCLTIRARRACVTDERLPASVVVCAIVQRICTYLSYI